MGNTQPACIQDVGSVTVGGGANIQRNSDKCNLYGVTIDTSSSSADIIFTVTSNDGINTLDVFSVVIEEGQLKPGRTGTTPVIIGNNVVLITDDGGTPITVIAAFNPSLTSMEIVIVESNCRSNIESIPDISDISISGCSLTTTGSQERNLITLNYVTEKVQISRSELVLTSVITIDVSDTTVTESIVANDFYGAYIQHETSLSFVFLSFFVRNNSGNLVISAGANLSGRASMIGTPLPSTPPPNNNFCTNPIITIRSITSSMFNNDILETVIDVQDGCVYDAISNNNCYKGCLTLIDNGTRFTIFLLFINCTLKSPNSISPSIRNAINVYAVLTLILGRLITGDLDIQWLFRCNYQKLLNLISCSRYNQFIPILNMFSDLDQFFRTEPCDP